MPLKHEDFYKVSPSTEEFKKGFPILIVDSGGCSNIIKGKNAEDFGFAAIFVSTAIDEFNRMKNGEIGLIEVKPEELGMLR